jgi:hypothetical protein
MRNALSKVFLTLLVSQVFFGLSSAEAGPSDFFRRIRESFAHPRHHQGTAAKTRLKRDNSATVKRNDFRPPELTETAAAESPTPVSAQMASGAPEQRPRADLPYGVPVPTQPGFVISPYSPNAGYVDIRGFSSGTEVKDPYTGKVFITP